MANPCGPDIPVRSQGDPGHLSDHNKLSCFFDNHIGPAAHDATSITNTPSGTISATTVQGAIDELASEKGTAFTFNVKDYGALGDGVADDTAAIQACIAASTPGSIISFPPGTYLISATLDFSSSRQYLGAHYTSGGFGSIIKQKNGANILNAMAASHGWLIGQNFTGTPIQIHNLTFDGNKANNPSSTASGFVMMNFLSNISHNIFLNNSNHGLLITDQALNGTNITNTQVENRVEHNKIITPNGHGIFVNDLAGNKNTDGFMNDNLVQNPGLSGIKIDRSAGWKVDGNHVYSCGASGISCNNAFATRISDNYIEQFGLVANADGTLFQAGLSAKVVSTRGAIVHGNQVYQGSDPANGNTFHYISVTGLTNPSYAKVVNNQLYGIINTNHIAINLGNSGGALQCALSDNQIDNFASNKAEAIAAGVTLVPLKRYGRQQVVPINSNASNLHEWYGDVTGFQAGTPLSKIDSSGRFTAPALISSGLTGATAASRHVGGTVSGAPTSGTFSVGDFVIDQSGKIWICTIAGTPGTWTQTFGGTYVVPAPTGTPATDLANIQAAIDAATAAGGGTVLASYSGTYQVSNPILMKSNVELILGKSIIKLANSSPAGTNILQTDQFQALTGGNTTGGPSRWKIIGGVFDGNKTNNASGGMGIAIYGRAFMMEGFEIKNCKSHGMWSEWGSSNIGNDNMESFFSNFWIHENDGTGWVFAGPHDSISNEFILSKNGIVSAGQIGGLDVRVGTSNGAQFSDFHIWGGGYDYGIYCAGSGCRFDGVVEGGRVAQVWIDASLNMFDGYLYTGGINTATAKGLIMGHSGGIVGGNTIKARVENCGGGAIDMTFGGDLNDIQIHHDYYTATVPSFASLGTVGTVSAPNLFQMTVNNNSFAMTTDTESMFPGRVRVRQIPGDTRSLFIAQNGGATIWNVDSAGRMCVGANASDPTCTPLAAAGTGATCTVLGGDQGGQLTLTTGTGASNAAILDVTYIGGTFTNNSVVVLQPKSANARALLPFITTTGAKFTINATAAIADATQYVFDFIVLGR